MKIGIIGESKGNGHPYSWSAIINGFDSNILDKVPFPAIQNYLCHVVPTNVLNNEVKVKSQEVTIDNSSIINFSSTYGVSSPKHFIYPEGFIKNIGYTISKAGVIGMSKYLATYLAPDIRVNTIIPGGVRADFDPEFISNYSKMTPMKRMMEKKEILGAIHYLASDDASYTTGSELTVDGGWGSW